MNRNLTIHYQSGVALALLLWFVAALALLVSGLALTAKTDIRTAQLQMLQAQVAAAAEGAALIYLQRLGELTEEGEPLPPQVQVGEMEVHLRLVPASGLIDYRQANDELLLQLFTTAAGLETGEAASLVESVIQWRAAALEVEPHRASGEAVGINVLEDLMAVPGISREIFERIRPLITVRGNGAEVDTSVAPVEVLQVLAVEDGAQVEDWLDEREDIEAPPVITGAVRVDARVQTSMGTFQCSLWVSSGQNGTGWQVERKLRVMGVESLEFDRLVYGEQ